MSVAHDAVSESHTGTTGSASEASFSWTHTPVGTPRGVVVHVLTLLATAKDTGVTYGGVAMDLLETAWFIADTGGEPGAINTYFLGAGIPTGAQTVQVNRTNDATVMYAAAATQTAATDTQAFGPVRTGLSGNSAFVEQSVNDGGSISDSQRYAFTYWGGSNVLSPGANSTALVDIDFGVFTAQFVRETTPGQGARSVGVDSAGGSDDNAGIHYAVREITGVQHDNSSESHTGTTGSTSEASFSWTHPGGSRPTGVTVFVFTVGTTPYDTGVTYGGVAMSLESSLTAKDTAGEPGTVRAYHLGSSVPAGSQSVVVSRTNNATAMYAAAATVLGLGDTKLHTAGAVLTQEDQTLAAQSVDDGSPGADSQRYAFVYSGTNAAATAATGSTGLQSISFGTASCNFARETVQGQGARNVGFTAGGSDDCAGVHVAVRIINTSLAVSGSITPAGANVQSVSQHLAAGMTPAGEDIENPTKHLDGAITPAGDLSTEFVPGGGATEYFDFETGAITPSGAEIQTVTKELTAGVTPSGAETQAVTKELTGGITPGGSLGKAVSKHPTGSVSPSGTLDNSFDLDLEGMVYPVSFPRQDPTKQLGAGITPTGALDTAYGYALALEGAITPTGALTAGNVVAGEHIEGPGAEATAIAKHLFIDGVDIITDVIIESAEFITLSDGQVGTCKFRIKDPDHDHNVPIGKRIVLTIGGLNEWQGYVSGARRVYAFAAQDTSTPAEVTRLIEVDGVDINTLFHKRIVFDKANPRNIEGPRYTTDNTPDLVAFQALVGHYLDLDGDQLDTNSRVAHVGSVNIDHPANPIQPTQDWANSMNAIVAISGAFYTINPDRQVVLADVDVETAPFRLSDAPLISDQTLFSNDFVTWSDTTPVTVGDQIIQGIDGPETTTTAIFEAGNSGTTGSSPPDWVPGDVIDNDITWHFVGYVADLAPTEFYGVRDLVWTLDGTRMVNDALIWGAGGGSSQVAFFRATDDDSVADHGRWQVGEFRPDMWKTATVQRRAESIVYGSPQNKRGGNQPPPQVTCTLFRQGIRVGMVAYIESTTFGQVDDLPVRRIRLTFPTHKDVRYELLLSHEIDQLSGLVDVFRINLPGLPGFPGFPQFDFDFDFNFNLPTEGWQTVDSFDVRTWCQDDTLGRSDNPRIEDRYWRAVSGT